MAQNGEYPPHFLRDLDTVAWNGCIAVEPFGGGGGLGVGLHRAGFTVLLANELVREAARTYSCNFPHVIVDTSDIRMLVTSRQAVEAFLAKAGIHIGLIDLMTGCPPCCEFTPLGGGLCDPTVLRVYSDTRQRGIGLLIFEFFRLVRFALPKTVLLENVPQLATTYGTLLKAALEVLRFTDAGERVYFAAHRVVRADDYGTPQRRIRLILIAVRVDVAESVGIRSDDDVLRVFPRPTHGPVSVRSALEGLRQTEADVSPWRAAMNASIAFREVALALPKHPPRLLRPVHVGLAPDRYFSTVRCSWDLPAPTLTVLGQQPNGLGGALHPEQDRKFTLPELRRLMGVPDDFRLTGTLAQGVERVCRMVPPPMAYAIASSIFETVLRPYYRGGRP